MFLSNAVRHFVSKTRQFSTATAANPPEVYNKYVSATHWLMAPGLFATVGAVLAAQNTEDKEEKGKWMFRHKSMGLAMGILIAPRIAFRLATVAPRSVPGSSLEKFLGDASHAALYGFMVIMPVTGVLMGYYGGKGLPFFSTTIKGTETPNKTIAGNSFKVHKFIGEYGKYLLPLHLGGVGFHYAKGQRILSRINPFKG
eukprot:m.265736 g.265736  ORF g.265736 m.265736 type:complete len:199 (+) comp29497_c0_seq1:43-639(+)